MSNPGGQSAAELVAELARAGTPPELLAAVAKELFAGEAERKVLAERREHERVRKARSRDVTGQAVTSEDVTPPPSPFAPPKKDPTPQKITPPISPNPEAQSRPCFLKGIGLPDWLPPEPWQAFVRMRKAIPKVPFTEDAARGAVRKVDKLRGEGYDPAKLLWKAVDSGWRHPFGHDDCKATRVGGGRDAAWHEDQAKFFESIGKPDDAAEHRRKALSIGQLAREIVK